MINSFNIRTNLNYQLRQDMLSTEAQCRMAKQRTVYRHRVAALRCYARLRALNAALVGACVMALAVLVTIWSL